FRLPPREEGRVAFGLGPGRLLRERVIAGLLPFEQRLQAERDQREQREEARDGEGAGGVEFVVKFGDVQWDRGAFPGHASRSHGPKNPCMPNRTMNIKPATTGDTENGRSMSVMSSDLPRNLNLAIAHAAARPNSTFNGTLIAATTSVRRMAAQESSRCSDA